MSKVISVDYNERKAFVLHLLYSVFDGIIKGVFVLNEFVFFKSLNGTEFQLGLLFQFSAVLLVFSVFFNAWISRVRNKKQMFLIVGILTRLPLFIFLFFPAFNDYYSVNGIIHVIFLAIFLMYYLANPLILPVINLLLKGAYSPLHFGKYFSYSTSAHKAALVVGTFVFGLFLDVNPMNFRFLYPLIGLISITSIILLSFIPFPESDAITKESFRKSISTTFRKMVNIFAINKPFRDYQIGFMIYGMSFMLTYPVIAIFYVNQLELSYSSIAFYNNVFNILAIVLLPFTGQIIGKLDPRTFASITFLSLAGYLFFIGITAYTPYYFEVFNVQIFYTLIFAAIMNSIFIASMALSWNIGSSYFCSSKEAGTYQSVHLTLTGVRAAFAPLLGIGMYKLIGFSYTFSAGIILLIIATIILRRSAKRLKIEAITT